MVYFFLGKNLQGESIYTIYPSDKNGRTIGKGDAVVARFEDACRIPLSDRRFDDRFKTVLEHVELASQKCSNDISGIGVFAAAREMSKYWAEHLKEGCTPKIILDDLHEAKNVLDNLIEDLTQLFQKQSTADKAALIEEYVSLSIEDKLDDLHISAEEAVTRLELSSAPSHDAKRQARFEELNALLDEEDFKKITEVFNARMVEQKYFASGLLIEDVRKAVLFKEKLKKVRQFVGLTVLLKWAIPGSPQKEIVDKCVAVHHEPGQEKVKLVLDKGAEYGVHLVEVSETRCIGRAAVPAGFTFILEVLPWH